MADQHSGGASFARLTDELNALGPRQPTCQRRTSLYDAPRPQEPTSGPRIAVCILFTQRWLVPLRVHNPRGVTQRRLAGRTVCFVSAGHLVRSPVRGGPPFFLEACSPLPLPNPFSLSPRGVWVWFMVLVWRDVRVTCVGRFCRVEMCVWSSLGFCFGCCGHVVAHSGVRG